MTIHCNQPEVDGPDCECLLDLESVCDFECAVLMAQLRKHLSLRCLSIFLYSRI